LVFSGGGTVLFHYPAGKTQPSGIYTVPQGILTIGRNAFDHNQTLKNIILSSSVTRIEDAAFWRCSELKNFEIPAGVTEIGSSVFSNCSELSAISVDSGNPSYFSTDGVLFDLAGIRLINIPRAKAAVIPFRPVQIMWRGRFPRQQRLQQIILSDSVCRIDNTAFAYCEGLADVKLGSGLSSIGGMAFQAGSALPSIVVPQSLETVETMRLKAAQL
jgi:hypothetical protein